MKTLWVFGATSAIAQATAQRFVEQGFNAVLIGRDQSKLEHLQQHYKTLGAKSVDIYVTELNNVSEPDALINDIAEKTQAPSAVLMAQGTLPKQDKCEASFATAYEALDVNAITPIALLGSLANRLEQQGHGALLVISSVAGDRGRQSNYVYGTAKAALSTFLSGLRNRLAPHGIQVLTIKPGFVDTPMTAEFDKGGPLWATPEQIANCIYNGYAKNRSVIYAPFFWRFIMLIIQHIPEVIFKRLKL